MSTARCVTPHICASCFFFFFKYFPLFRKLFNSNEAHQQTHNFSAPIAKSTQNVIIKLIYWAYIGDSDVCLHIGITKWLTDFLVYSSSNEKQTEIETCQTIQLQLCNKRLEQESENKKQTKSNQIIWNWDHSYRVHHMRSSPSSDSVSDQKEQRVAVAELLHLVVVSLVHQMPQALQDIKILYDRHFALFLPPSLHCLFLSFW